MQKDDDEVGYGRPPKHSRFKPGESGNWSGRPKHSAASFMPELVDELSQICEDDGGASITNKRSIAKKLIADARHDPYLALALLNLLTKHSKKLDEVDPRAVDDDAFVKTLAERELQADEAISAPNPEDKK